MNTANIGKTQDEALTDTTIKVTTDEILIAFLSNIEYMSEAQVEAAVKAIAYYKPEMIKRLGLLDG
ncbi:hypothetical protein [Crocosphaera sp. XPORK-15E]|uniref:hypothetical protein n=1 Tax=Crocosphaera sp. XPORK-15E TaxID=3110247 RepID=UPI002B20AF02|nr:hypothetical protein [Crocosphaera sp. XPORK-15E]MEA5536773.1 hypothetical protein [Crocosphaera sp. XPORK-15E]